MLTMSLLNYGKWPFLHADLYYSVLGDAKRPNLQPHGQEMPTSAHNIVRNLPRFSSSPSVEAFLSQSEHDWYEKIIFDLIH